MLESHWMEIEVRMGGGNKTHGGDYSRMLVAVNSVTKHTNERFWTKKHCLLLNTRDLPGVALVNSAIS